jgi:histidine triad (HIT) family protein
MSECVFCRIAKKELSSDVIYEDKKILGFKNIRPEASVHFLFIPKKHIEWEKKFTKSDLSATTALIAVAKKVMIKKKIFGAAKLIFNIGKTGEISHIHLHLLGGWKNKIPKNNI